MTLKISLPSNSIRQNNSFLRFSIVSLLVFFNCTLTLAQADDTSILNQNTIRFANDVFKDCPEYLTNVHLQLYNREVGKVFIINMEQSEMPDLKRLSSCGLKNKCNPELTAEFNPKDFNPLKYFLNFYSESDQYIRVDNSDFVIFIKGTSKSID